MVGQVGLDLPANKRYPDGSVPRRWDECAAVIQAFFRKYQPPTLIVWGKNDFIFPPEGAKCSRRPETCGDASTGHTRGGAPSVASALTLARIAWTKGILRRARGRRGHRSLRPAVSGC